MSGKALKRARVRAAFVGRGLTLYRLVRFKPVELHDRARRPTPRLETLVLLETSMERVWIEGDIRTDIDVRGALVVLSDAEFHVFHDGAGIRRGIRIPPGAWSVHWL